MRVPRFVRLALAVGTVGGLTVPLLVGSSAPAAGVSYNPAPANHFHAPLSSVAISALSQTFNPHGADNPNGGAANPSSNSPLARPTSAGAVSSIPLPPNIIRFNTDQSYMPQSETTIAVDPNNASHVVGGVNDSRVFFCPFLSTADCPSGYTESLSGFTTSSDGGHSVAVSDDIPSLTVNSEYLRSWGDPNVRATIGGNFFYTSLAIDPRGTAFGNGVEIAISNSQLWTDPSSCVTPLGSPTSNPCWTAALVFGNTGGSASAPILTFEDKPMLSVDMDPSSPYYGDAYIGWDHFNADGTSSSYLARCDQSLHCTMLSGDTAPVVSGSDPFPAFTTPVVDANGNVYVTWCNYGTTTALIPIVCKEASSGPGGTSFGSTSTILSTNGGLDGYAMEQFRTTNIPVLAVDTSNKKTAGNLYFTIDVCTAGNYFDFTGAGIPGDCGASGVLFSRSTDGGATWSTPVNVSANAPGSSGVNPADATTAQPWVTVDPKTGEVNLVYYTTQFDAFDHRIDVEAAGSPNGGKSWSFDRITRTSIEPDSDPAYYNFLAASGFGGSFIVPQFGDYLQAAAMNGKLWTSFCATYTAELGTFQTDPYLAITNEP